MKQRVYVALLSPLSKRIKVETIPLPKCRMIRHNSRLDLIHSLMKPTLIAPAMFATLSACEKPTAKFRPGDKVRVKLTDTKGVVAARLSPFVDDQYYLKVPGNERNSHREYLYCQSAFVRPWHYEGPYLDTELEVAK